MLGWQFEQFLFHFFKQRMYKAKSIRGRHEAGGDLLCTQLGRRIVVQAKYKQGKTGVCAVRQAFTAREYYHADRALVIAPHGFTRDAKKLVNSIAVELMDFDQLHRGFW